MSMRYKGGVISATAPVTSASAAKGVWTLQQQLQALAAGNWTGYVPPVGSALGGGYFAGQISTAGNGIADYNLVVGPVSSAQSLKQWKTANTTTTGTSSNIDGPTNSSNMNNATHPAAQFCEGLTIGGFSDWYMPAKYELEVCYFNLKPTTTSNVTSGAGWDGTNPNAVPARASQYSSGTPAQTSSSDFKSTGAEDFSSSVVYWASTGFSGDARKGNFQGFDDGVQYGDYKVNSNNVRAVRRVAI